MSWLPDPRGYSTSGDNALVRLAEVDAHGGTGALRAEIRRLLDAGDDAALRAALAAAPSPSIYRALWHGICAVAEGQSAGETSQEAIVARPFAIPVIFVAGARRPLKVSGTISDIVEVTALLERHGALGVTRNFGLGAGLCPLEAMERIAPSRVFGWNRAFSGAAPDSIEGTAIDVAPGREQAHLRFILGAGITPAHLPSFIETASDISRWGAAFTQALARQLAQPGLELLPLARPPAGLLTAAHAGRRAVLEIAFQLFASHAVRTCRMTAGEPVIIVSAHREARAAEVRVSVSSLLDDALLEGFRWPLHPLDDLVEIETSIAELLDACRVGDVRRMPDAVIESAPGATAFISVREFDRMSGISKRH